jgi:hypothetical protein
MSVKTNIDSIIRGNRQRAVSKGVVKGGEAGKTLAKSARLSTDVTNGMVMVDGEQKKVFILGMHPMTDDYVIL